ncbi:hypothetical protein [Virgibacillus dakarensis]|uniref:hypothetical protein n=1 Tax=Virgibacillus dakarensis TaxID=1917889 RepID=UPI000B437B7B|nr:hypothetical protein [Virgibacillus dakarensis]
MWRFTAKEATEFFRSSGADCDEKLVQEWMNDTNRMHIDYGVRKDDFIHFDIWKRQKGTAHEDGISDRIKIARLCVEINGLKKEISVLTKERNDLKDKLEVMTS